MRAGPRHAAREALGPRAGLARRPCRVEARRRHGPGCCRRRRGGGPFTGGNEYRVPLTELPGLSLMQSPAVSAPAWRGGEPHWRTSQQTFAAKSPSRGWGRPASAGATPPHDPQTPTDRGGRGPWAGRSGGGCSGPPPPSSRRTGRSTPPPAPGNPLAGPRQTHPTAQHLPLGPWPVVGNHTRGTSTPTLPPPHPAPGVPPHRDPEAAGAGARRSPRAGRDTG